MMHRLDKANDDRMVMAVPGIKGTHSTWLPDGSGIVSDVKGPQPGPIVFINAPKNVYTMPVCLHGSSYVGHRQGHPHSESTHPGPIDIPNHPRT